MVRPATAIATMALVLALVFAPAAPAALGLNPSLNGSFSVGLTGVDQTRSYTFRVTPTNPNPSITGGYHLTIVASNLDDGAGHTLAPGTIQSVAVGGCVSGGCPGTPPSNAIAYPIAIPNAVPVTFFNATPNTGLANFRVTPTVSVAIPANTHAGVYSTTITTAIVAGP
jgi:hypothetical protein